MTSVVLYKGSDSNKEVSAQLSAGYDIMYDQLKDQYGSEEELKKDMCDMIQTMVFKEIQNNSDSPQLHPAFVKLIESLQETGEVDFDALAQNSVHQLSQIS